MKAGWKTTEFWITVATQVAIITAVVADMLPKKYAAIAVAVSGAAYALARGLAKKPV